MNHTVYPALFNVLGRNEHRRAVCSGYAVYERRKAEWARQNPNATPAEFEAAMARIARESGV